MSIELWAAIMAAAALVVSLVAAYYAKHSVNAAERSALAAERAADAAEDQAKAVGRANELYEQARRRGVRAIDATSKSARAVGWEVERSPDPHLVRLRNVGEAAATNVTVEPSRAVRILDRVAPGLGGPTVEVHEAVDLGLMLTAEHATPSVLLVSWDGVPAPVRVPIPPE